MTGTPSTPMAPRRPTKSASRPAATSGPQPTPTATGQRVGATRRVLVASKGVHSLRNPELKHPLTLASVVAGDDHGPEAQLAALDQLHALLGAQAGVDALIKDLAVVWDMLACAIWRSPPPSDELIQGAMCFLIELANHFLPIPGEVGGATGRWALLGARG